MVTRQIQLSLNGFEILEVRDVPWTLPDPPKEMDDVRNPG